jgi:serine O-acetyltransferase
MDRRTLWKELIQNVRADLERYIATGASSRWKVIFLYQGFWASSVYRFTRFLFLFFRNTPLRFFASALAHFLQKLIQILTGISLPFGCDIGPGLYIAHFGGIILHPQAKLGENCNLGVQVVIGYGKSNGLFGYPVLRDRVFVGPGAKILGPIQIGHDAAIGANAVVLTDVPDRGVVGGVPAKVINQAGSFEYVFYPDMDQDLARRSSLQEAIQSGERTEIEGRLHLTNS